MAAHEITRERTAARFYLPLVMLAALAILGGLLAWDPPAYNAAIDAIGFPPGPVPLLDWVYIAANVECWQKGINVYLSNPCDPLGRLMDYSPLWLRATFLPVAQPWVGLVGLAGNLLFIASLALMPTPRSTRGGIIMVLCGLSSFTVFALERGNVDVLVFALLVCATRLWLRSLPERLIGYALIVSAALLKFYPLVALVLAARESLRTLILVALATILASVGFVWYFHAELMQTFPNVPGGSYLSGGLFGAQNFPRGLMLLLDHARGTALHLGGPVDAFVAKAVGPDGWGGKLLEVLCILVSFGLSLSIASRLELVTLLGDLPEREAAFLMVGSALVAGCFFAGQNVNYRGIFLILPVPGLLALSALARRPGQRRLLVATCIVVVLLMWEPAVNRRLIHLFGENGTHGAVYLVLWFLRESGWWWTVSVLDAALICLLARWLAVQKLVPSRFLARLDGSSRPA